MAIINFLGSKIQSFKDDGSVNASGTIEFFAVGGAFSTYVTSYTSSSLATANSNVITLDSAGRADVWLNSDADVRIKDSSGTTLDTQLNVNPDVATTSANDNLVENPSFEDDTNSDTFPDSWDRATFTGGTAAIDTSDRSHGANSMKFVSTGSGGGTITSTTFFSVNASASLYWAFDLKSTADVRNLAQILWYDASQVALGSPSTDLYDDSTTNPTTWTQKVGVVSVPATAYFGKFKFFGAHSSDATAGTVRIDNISISVTPRPSHNITETGNRTQSGTLTMSGKSIWFAEGAAVASDAGGTTNIWTTDGNTIHVTGTNAITSFGTAPQAGAMKAVIFDGALTLTHGANLNIPGAANITTAAGDWCLVYGDTTTQLDVVDYVKASGLPLLGYPASQGASTVLIATATASASNYFLFPTQLNSTYDEFEINLVGVRPTTDDTTLKLQITTDSGSTYVDSGTLYNDSGNVTDGGGNTGFGLNGRNYLSLSGELGVGSATTRSIVGPIKNYKPTSAALWKQWLWDLGFTKSGGNQVRVTGAGVYGAVTAITGCRLFFATAGTNTIAEGVAYLRALKKS